MTTTYDDAADMARKAVAGGPADGLLERLAELLGSKATVHAVFGEPVHDGTVTVVPVARIRWGFGGGGGRSDDAPTGAASGSGGGGGVAADAVGYIELANGQVTFRPIRDAFPSPALLLAGGIAAAVVLRALARLLGR